MVESLRPAIADSRVFARFRRLLLSQLTTEERRTITHLMETSGRMDHDWSGDYRVFSRDAWESTEVFARLLPSVISLHTVPPQLVVASLDDTNVRKTGRHIPGVSYRRDPMSPPFQANLIRAQRFVQTSIAVPFGTGASPCRAIPVAFDHAPSCEKLRKDASAEELAAHRQRARSRHLAVYGTRAIERLRNDLNGTSAAAATLLVAVDGSYTNAKVLRNLPPQTHLIGRIRKDAVLHHPPREQPARGRRRRYGEELTPERVRQDESIPWTSVKIFAAGRVHDCDVKEVTPLLWRTTGSALPLRLIVIRPLAYRRSATSRLLYRAPAYLITTDLTTPLCDLVQAYFWRWDIEVNHRDEKQLIGLGDAQVRSPRSASRVPAFVVASYAVLLISAARAFGLAASEPVVARPKWLAGSRPKPIRLSTNQLLARLRTDRRASAVELPNFDDFASHLPPRMKSSKSPLTTAQALHAAFN
ncbi:MAG: IS701 family transposase [Thermoanaerobaculia bacterium]